MKIKLLKRLRNDILQNFEYHDGGWSGYYRVIVAPCQVQLKKAQSYRTLGLMSFSHENGQDDGE